MGKILFWIVVFFVILFALRLANVAAGIKRRNDEERERESRRRRELTAEPTVRCTLCGTYLPKAEALPAPDGYRCGAPGCAARR